MSFRRGWTHGVLAQATLRSPSAAWSSGASAAGDRASTGRSRPATAVRPRTTAIAVVRRRLLHVFMDFTNSYGVRLLMPFSDRWFYGDALYIVDPWLYLIARGGSGWLAGAAVRRSGADRPRALLLAAIYMIAMLASNVLGPRPPFARPGARRTRPPTRDSWSRRCPSIRFGAKSWSTSAIATKRAFSGSIRSPHFRPAGFGMTRVSASRRSQAALATPRAQAVPAMVALSVRGGRSDRRAPRVISTTTATRMPAPHGWYCSASSIQLR